MTSIALPILVVGAPVVLGYPFVLLFRRDACSWNTCVLEAWAWGTVWFGVLATTVGAVRGSLTLLGGAWILAAMIALCIARLRGSAWMPAVSKRGTVGAAGIALAGVLMAALAPTPWTVERDDAAHVAEIRAAASQNEIFPQKSFHELGEVPGPDPRFGSIHAYYALLARWADTLPEDVWLAGRPATAAAIWLAFFELATVLVGSTAGLWATFIAIGVFGGERFDVHAAAMYPIWVGLALVWLAVAQWSRRLDGGRTTKLELATPVALSALHFFPWLAFWGLLACAVLARLGRERRYLLAPQLRTMALVAIGSVGILALRLVLTYGSDNPIHERPWNIMGVGDGFYVFQPSAIFEATGVLGSLGPVLALILLRRGTLHGSSAMFLLWTCLIPLALPANPLAVTLLEPVLGFLVYRTVLLSLFPVVAGALVVATLRDSWHKALILPFALSILGAAWLRAGPSAAAQFDKPWRHGAKSVAAQLDSDDVVLSDPYTMLGLTAFAGANVVAVPDGRSSPRDPEAFDRLLAASIAMAPDSPRDLREIAANSYPPSHLLLYSWPNDFRGYLYSYRADEQSDLERKWQSIGATLISEHGRFRLYSLVGVEFRPDESLWGKSPPAPAEQPTLRGAVSPRRLRIGERLAVRLHAADVRRPEGIDMPRVFARLDRSPMTGGDRFLGKLFRKLREQLTNEVERTRTELDLSPARVVEAVRTDGSLELQSQLQVPSTLRPGIYHLRVRWSWEGRTHDEALRDLFYNEDSYSGQTLAEVEVTP